MVHVTDEQVRRLQDASASGQLPADLVPLVFKLAGGVTPDVRLALTVSELIDRWMVRRRVTAGELSVSRRTIARCLKAQNVTLSTVADVADALDCDVVIDFKPRA